MATALSSRRALHTLHRRLLLLHPTPSPAPSSSPYSRFFTARPDARLGYRLLQPLPQRLVGGVRSASTGGRSKLAPLGQGVKGQRRPVEAWRRNYMILVGAEGVIVCVALWRIMFDNASTFIGLSEGMAKYGFLALALATAIVAFAGSKRKGLVSGEVTKKKEQYDMKVLAVYIPMASGPGQRLYLIGDKQDYEVGGGLISELRDPILKDMAAEQFDYLGKITRGG